MFSCVHVCVCIFYHAGVAAAVNVEKRGDLMRDCCVGHVVLRRGSNLGVRRLNLPPCIN